MTAGDKRKTGEGALKGWETRRLRQAERQAAINLLIDVMDEVGGMVVHGVPSYNRPGSFDVGATTLIGWRDRLSKAVHFLRRP